MRTVDNFFSNINKFESKLFVTGISSDLSMLLDGLLTDEQKSRVIKEIDRVYTEADQLRIKQQFVDKLG